MKATHILSSLTLALLILGCSKVPITGRKQLKLISSNQMMGMSTSNYGDFLTQNPPMPDSDPRTQQVKRVGERIQKAVEKYMNDNHLSKRIEGFEWEFNLVDQEVVNAWCMPGGKVVFYTGILPITKDEEGLAVVMGHEIAHAVAKHGNERMSQQLAVQAGGVGLAIAMNEKPQLTQNLFMQAYGLSSTMGVLKFSRTHESEADKMGLIFMAMAGYNPRVAPEFWERMAAMSEGQAPPEFMSTHPSHDTRVKDLNDFMDEALKYYNP